ncbi:hypothetical protein D9613_011526 [Agrocybe pediades]|uniref:Uncharacterized protein n=1 Tax=Agrocybe pediades TaxID=84607 RepID=A0A8H4QX39_9AGAR|nr:hypothetical protein D9613_011526 [Agrocybe pediades]
MLSCSTQYPAKFYSICWLRCLARYPVSIYPCFLRIRGFQVVIARPNTEDDDSSQCRSGLSFISLARPTPHHNDPHFLYQYHLVPAQWETHTTFARVVARAMGGLTGTKHAIADRGSQMLNGSSFGLYSKGPEQTQLYQLY